MTLEQVIKWYDRFEKHGFEPMIIFATHTDRVCALVPNRYEKVSLSNQLWDEEDAFNFLKKRGY